MTGRVLSLHRWPVKSMGGEPVGALRIDPRGAGGDRTHAVWHVHKGEPQPLTAREAPGLLAWSARYATPGDALDPTTPPEPELTAPDGTRFAWSDPALPAALSDDLGRAVTLRRDLRGQQDLADSLLVTVEGTRADAERTLATPLDLRRFRTNIHIEIAAPPWAEQEWEGHTLAVGETDLQLLHPCERCVIPTRDPDTQDRWPQLLKWLNAERGTCFGINARPPAPATIRVDDSVELR
ncbi:MAG: MOSC domain-containing protein [Solirubrobacteraceae bacterium]|nr:MOSC domain-containing protein [Solirubrobacteraceae bacterium]